MHGKRLQISDEVLSLHPKDILIMAPDIVMLTKLQFVLLVDTSNLLLNIHNLHPLHFFALIQLPVIAQRCPLSPRGLLVADDWLASHTVEDITALGSETLEIGGYIGG